MPFKTDKPRVKPIHRDFYKDPPPLSSIFIHTTARDNLLIIPSVIRHARCFLGIGRVMKISRGKEFDLVTMNFSLFRAKYRTIIVFDNHARRQIFGLKKGEFAWTYGILKRYKDKHKETQKLVWHYALIGYMFDPVYTPKSIDIKRYEEDIKEGKVKNEMDNMSERQLKTFDWIADDILRNDGLKPKNLGEDDDDWNEFFKPFDQVEDD